MTTVMQDTERARPSLPGELSDLLIELAAGLQRAHVYGPRHPAVAEAAESFVARLSGRRRDRGTLSVVTTGRALIVEVRGSVQLLRQLRGVTTGLEHPLLGALAGRMAVHEVSAIDLAEGVKAEEIAAILRYLATDPAQTGRFLGREDDETLAAVAHVRIHRGAPESPRGLQDSGPRGAPEDDGHGAGASRGPQADARAWSAFARTALAIPGEYADRAYSPDEVATAILARSGSPEFREKLGRQLKDVGERLGRAGPLEAIELGRSMSNVLRRLDAETLRILMSAAGDAGGQVRLLGNLAGSLDLDVVLDLVRAASEAENSDISRWMLRLLSKLARHADVESGALASRSDAALRERIRALVSDWELESPNPDDYEETLARALEGGPVESDGAGSRSVVEAERLVAMVLETDVDTPCARRAVDEMIAAGKFREIVAALDAAPASPIAAAMWERLAERPVLQRLVQQEEPDWEVLDRILPRAGLVAAEPLLDRLMAAESMAVRRHLFDHLVGLGPGVGACAVRCLGRVDETPWFVLRNVLALLALLGTWPEEFDPWSLTDHPNPQVRLEALKLSLCLPETRDRAVLRALDDENSRIAALGILEAERACPEAAVPRLARIALEEEGDFAEFRTHSIRALAGSGGDVARDALLAIARPRRRGLRRTEPDPCPALVAALRGLAAGWPDDPYAREALVAARSSKHLAIREAAS